MSISFDSYNVPLDAITTSSPRKNVGFLLLLAVRLFFGHRRAMEALLIPALASGRDLALFLGIFRRRVVMAP